MEKERFRPNLGKCGCLIWALKEGQFKIKEKTTGRRDNQEVEKKPRRKHTSHKDFAWLRDYSKCLKSQYCPALKAWIHHNTGTGSSKR